MNQVLNEHQPTAPDRAGTVRLEDVTPAAASATVDANVGVNVASSATSEETSGSGIHKIAHTMAHSGDSRMSKVQGASVSVVTAVDVATPTSITTSGAAKTSIRFPPSTVEFRNVTFSYRKSKTGAGKATTITSGVEDGINISSSGSGTMNDYSAWYGESEHVLLDNISFSIAAGENVAIVGPSGSGKLFPALLLLRVCILFLSVVLLCMLALNGYWRPA